MKNKLALVVFSLKKITPQHIQMFFVVLSLAMLVVGAGAPASDSDTGR
jgi:hypothetical protein